MIIFNKPFIFLSPIFMYTPSKTPEWNIDHQLYKFLSEFLIWWNIFNKSIGRYKARFPLKKDNLDYFEKVFWDKNEFISELWWIKVSLIQDKRVIPTWFALRIDLWSQPVALNSDIDLEKYTHPLDKLVLLCLLEYHQFSYSSDIFLTKINNTKKEVRDILWNINDYGIFRNPRNFSQEWWAMYTTQNFDAKPKYIIEIEGETFYITNMIQWINPNNIVIWYVSLAGKIHPRLFYYSNSWWNWHCAPWVYGWDLKKKLSKWEMLWMSYEKGTVIHTSLQSLFTKLPLIKVQTNINARHQESQTPLPFDDEPDIILENLFTDFHLDGVKIEQLLDDKRVFWLRFWRKYHNEAQNTSHLAFALKNIPIPDEMIKNLKFNKMIGIFTHNLLQIHYRQYQFITTWNGRKVQVLISIGDDKPNLVWVDNISFDRKNNVSTWGFDRKQINAWIITTKPIEYISQCPEFMNWETVIWDKYYDIRQYIQSIPMIQQVKELLKKENMLL